MCFTKVGYQVTLPKQLLPCHPVSVPYLCELLFFSCGYSKTSVFTDYGHRRYLNLSGVSGARFNPLVLTTLHHKVNAMVLINASSIIASLFDKVPFVYYWCPQKIIGLVGSKENEMKKVFCPHSSTILHKQNNPPLCRLVVVVVISYHTWIVFRRSLK